MSDLEKLKKETKLEMADAISNLQTQLGKLRTGRASPSMLDDIRVDNYGQLVPLKQMANISTEDSRTLSISAWDKGSIQAIEKAIMKSDLGLNPSTAGLNIRIIVPPMTEETRKAMVKQSKVIGENIKVSVRNARRDANNKIKHWLKDSLISENDEKKFENEIQKLTDASIVEVDNILKKKEAELMSF